MKPSWPVSAARISSRMGLRGQPSFISALTDPILNSMQGIESVAAPGALFADELLEGRKRQAQVRGRKAKVETDAVAELILAATHRRHVHEGKRGH